MSRAIAMICAILFSFSGTLAQDVGNLSKKEQKVLRKEQQRIEDSLAYDKSVRAINEKSWVLEAYSIQSRRGMTYQVTGNTNFVMIADSRGTVQLASPMRAGYNGLGGITVDGNISGYKVSADKKGSLYVEFYILGVGINATVLVSLYPDSNRAQVTISSNTWGQRITYNGYIYPREESNVFKGIAL